MAFLYINPKGKSWRKHSYSAGNVFDTSPKKYYLQKVLGWKEKATKARFEFGKALETAIQWYHEHNGQGAITCFANQWEQYRNNPDLQYTRAEKDWATCLKTGTEMIKLYMIRQPELPIPMGGQTIFQREYSKEVFPGSPDYGEIEDAGKLDIVAYVDPNHPMLPKLDWKPEYGNFRPLIVDIKTAGTDFPEAYGIAAFDTQLRRYSWLSGIRDVALLWFVKKSHKLQKGYSVTLLEDAGHFKAGQEAVIAQVNGDDVVLVANDFMLEEMERAQGVSAKTGKTDQTNEGKARRDEWLLTNSVKTTTDSITKQRLQFNAGYVTIESAQDAGHIAARQIVGIVHAWRTNQWPNTFGIRYPHDDRSDPYFRAFVLGDEIFKKQNFIKVDENAMDDLFEDTDIEAE